jgi:putative flippase GtrA
MMKKLLDRSLILFLVIGAGNTLLSMGIMYLLYTRLGFERWGATAVAFTVTSVLSFLLNKKLSFQYEGHVWAAALRFAMVIAACYLFANSLAKPVTEWLMWKLLGASVEAKTIELAAYLTVQVLFTGLNYFGQRFFAFRKGETGEP